MYQGGRRVTLPGMAYFVIGLICLLIGYKIGSGFERARIVIAFGERLERERLQRPNDLQ
jgi:hypothetical protein